MGDAVEEAQSLEETVEEPPRDTRNLGEARENLESRLGETIHKTETPQQADSEGEFSYNDARQNNGKAEEGGKAPDPRNLDGALVIIEYEDPKTGEVRYFFERKTFTYPVDKEQRGQLALGGGGIKEKDASRLAAMKREIREEIASQAAQNILIKALDENPNPLYEQVEYVNGYRAVNYVWHIKLKSEEEMRTVFSSGMTEGAPEVLTLEKTWKNVPSGFAYRQGEIIKRHIEKHHLEKIVSGSLNFGFISAVPAYQPNHPLPATAGNVILPGFNNAPPTAFNSFFH